MIILPSEFYDGSSPLARGTRSLRSRTSGRERFIPAGAGNTQYQLPFFPRRAVHPRWRGEHGNSSRFPAISIGSSPLARGTRFAGIDGARDSRFIPAGAGNTSAAGGLPEF